jgi:TonB family protein
MRESPEALLDVLDRRPAELHLVVESEPWGRVFADNLRDLLNPPEAIPLVIKSKPGEFWPDVFVDRALPWRRLLESGGYHILAIMVILAGSRWLALQPHIIPQDSFSHADVVYYSQSEYLPPLDTRRSSSRRERKADPELASQPIISVPPEADNRSQTVVTAPSVQLKHDVALPNTVAWSDKPRMPIAPVPLVPASEISRIAPELRSSIVAPPPDLTSQSRQVMPAPESSVVAPPPTMEAASNRRLGDLNVGHAAVIAPAPQLALDEQRTVPGARSGAPRGQAPQVIAPPPSVGAAGGSRSGRDMVALSLHPAVGAPPAAGNRRGSFSATPEGHKGASGTPGGLLGNSSDSDHSVGKNDSGKLPAGLYVGKTSNAASSVAGESKNSNSNSVNPNLLANARPPRMTKPSSQENEVKLSAPERAVFGDRKVYSLSLNMPNLNSAGGSWIIRFAALKTDSALPNSSATVPSADLSSPVATRKVDPAYPLEVMRQNVSGTVILYGVIHADGTVANVHVLRSVDDRLDRYASEAIAKWQFQPATRNGTAVDVEATFWIPFKPSRVGSNF